MKKFYIILMNGKVEIEEIDDVYKYLYKNIITDKVFDTLDEALKYLYNNFDLFEIVSSTIEKCSKYYGDIIIVYIINDMLKMMENKNVQ